MTSEIKVALDKTITYEAGFIGSKNWMNIRIEGTR